MLDSSQWSSSSSSSSISGSGPSDYLVPTHAELVAARSAALEAAFATGQYERFVWPYGLVGFYLVFAYMLMPPPPPPLPPAGTARGTAGLIGRLVRSPVFRLARYPLWAFNVWWCVGSILRCRSHNPPLQYGIGLANAYACVWLAFHVVWRDSRTQSCRIVERGDGGSEGLLPEDHQRDGRRRELGQREHVPERSGDESLGKSSAVEASSGLVQRSGTDREAKERTGVSISEPQTGLESTSEEYYWQSPPSAWIDRFYWVCTMILCLRGEGTSHGIRQLPSPPAHVRASLRRNSPWMPEPAWVAAADRQGKSDVFGPPTKRAAMRYYLATWAVTYLLLDVAKNLIERDPYFTGFVPITAPLPLSPSLISRLPEGGAPFIRVLAAHPIFAKAARLALCCSAIVALLTNLTSLPPLLFCGVLGLRYRPWLFPTLYGSGYAEIVRKGGIAGWWGRWWHQMFRASFEAPQQALCRAISPGKIDPRSTAGRLLGMLVAFGLSAALHAAGSATLNGDTRPWAGSGAFFLVQPLGIVVELAGRWAAVRSGLASKAPRWTRTAAAVLWVHFWLYHTAPLLSDDVAAGGVWTTEVVPLSIVGGLSGNRWVRWEWWMMPTWHTDEKWWKSGIAF